MTLLPGADVASYQGKVDFAQVKGAGIQWCATKCSEQDGSNYVNPFYASDMAGMLAAGIARGSYMFARPDLNTAQVDFDLYHANANLQPGDVPIIDWERLEGSLPWLKAQVQLFNDAYKCWPWLYSSLYYLQATGCINDPLLSNCGLWLSAPGTVAPTLPPGWNFWAAWQDNWHGILPGIAGEVDLDLGNFTNISQFIAYGLPTTKPVPPPVAKPFDLAAKFQLVTYVANGSGVTDLEQWLAGYADVPAS